MGYTKDESMVRVDFFKLNGSWEKTEAIKWVGGWDKINPIMEAFKKSIRNHFKDDPDKLFDTDAICLKPYHELSHPIQLKAGAWRE